MTAFQQRNVALEFVEKRRAAIPYGAEQITLMLRLVHELVSTPKVIVDLGCGDGILTKALLGTYTDARAILIDHSSIMLEQANETLSEYRMRFENVESDLSNDLVDAVGLRTNVDVVVSGFAIHHLSDERKRYLYAEIFDILSPGGVFINIEHVASPDSEIERIWDYVFIEHIAGIQSVTIAQAAKEYRERPDKADNILAPVETQTQWLREIGYEHVDCYFKWFELAVFGGQKPRIKISG